MGGGARRVLGIVAALLAGGGAIYLWAINLAILRDHDLRTIEELQLEVMSTRDALRRAGGDGAFLSDAAVSLLRANDRVPAAKKAAGVVLHRGTTRYVAARHLPPAPRGKAYALWVHVGGKVLPAGQFQCAADGTLRGRHSLPREVQGIEGFSVTLEATGSTGPPSGAAYLVRS